MFYIQWVGWDGLDPSSAQGEGKQLSYGSRAPDLPTYIENMENMN